MRKGFLTFLLIFSVSSSQANFTCIQKYVECSIPLINKWNDPVNCSLAVPLIDCITSVSRDCDSNATPLLENFGNLLKDACSVSDVKREEWKNASECVVKNANTLKVCTTDLPENDCRASNRIIECTSSTMHEKCGKFAGEVIDKLMYPLKLLTKGCVDVRESGDNEITECLMNNTKRFLSCKLTGEFNTMRDMCSSVDNFIQCIVRNSEEACGQEAKKEVESYTGHITFAMKLCNEIKAVGDRPISECNKETLKCNVNIFNVNELQCTDFSQYVGCLADATGKCKIDRNELFVIVMEKYKSKFPEYCNKDSSFNKNLEKWAQCIDSKTSEVVGTCYDNLRNDIDRVTTVDVAGNQRAYLNFLHCLRGGFKDKCSEEAGDAVNDLLHPLGDSLDESCRLLTGKRCNSACGLNVATWIFIACLTYLITRKHE